FGDIELIQKHLRSYDIVRKPLQSIAPDALKRSAPECRYVVTDGEGRVVLAGPVPPAEDASFSVDLAGALPPGHFTLRAQIIVNANAVNAEIQRIPIDVASKPGRSTRAWTHRRGGLAADSERRTHIRPR